MPIPGSDTYKATSLSESLATRSTTPSAASVPPEAIHGPDWVAQDPRSVTVVSADPYAKTSSLGVIALQSAPVTPTLLGLNPDSAPVPGPDKLIVVHGTGFTEESIIVWNDQDVVTVFEREDKLNTTISMTAVGIDPVYVRNEDLKSNVLSFTFTPAEAKGAKKAAPEEKHGHHKKH